MLMVSNIGHVAVADAVAALPLPMPLPKGTFRCQSGPPLSMSERTDPHVGMYSSAPVGRLLQAST